MSVDALIAELEKRRTERYVRGSQAYRQDHPRASSIGDCAREIALSILHWQLKPVHSAELLQRFRRGNEVERIVTRELLEDGWDLSEHQLPFEITEQHNGRELIICTGHVDGRIKWEGDHPVHEIKSLNPNVWNRVDSLADFKRMGSFWSRYVRQILLYCYANNEEYGLFILDDCLGHWKFTPAILDDWLDECEEALQIARRAAIAVHDVKAGVDYETALPPHHTNPAVCRKCWAREAGVCFPPMGADDGAIKVIDDATLAADLARMTDLEEGHREYLGLDKWFKEQMKARGEGEYIADKFAIHVTRQKRKKTTATITKWEQIGD